MKCDRTSALTLQALLDLEFTDSILLQQEVNFMLNIMLLQGYIDSHLYSHDRLPMDHCNHVLIVKHSIENPLIWQILYDNNIDQVDGDDSTEMIVALILTELVKRVSDKRAIKFLQNLCFYWLQSGNKQECGKDISIAAYVELL